MVACQLDLRQLHFTNNQPVLFSSSAFAGYNYIVDISQVARVFHAFLHTLTNSERQEQDISLYNINLC